MNQRTVIATCLVGLPVGLVALGVGSMIYTELLARTPAEHAEAEARERSREYSELLRKPVTREALERTVSVLSRDIGERHVGRAEALESAALFLESSMGPSNMGYPITRQIFDSGGVKVRNVEAELVGTSREDEIVVIGAHYDTAIGTPGADDNASGVAALLALANAFVATDNARTLRFVGFVNEEPPHFQTPTMGSLVYAGDCKAKDENIVAMIALESLGYFSDAPGSQNYPKAIAADYPTVGNFIAFVGNLSSRKLVDTAHAAFVGASDFPAEKGAFPGFVQGVGWSDHWAFWEHGYPAIMVTDTAPFRNANYHQPTDTIDTLDLDRMATAVSGLAAVIDALVNPEEDGKKR